jgi:hypothetical protein
MNSGKSASNLKVTFGLKGGRLYRPDDVLKGLPCECVCPACEVRLVANHGRVKRSYFSHHRSESCPGGYETAVHLMAKQVIADEMKIYIPATTVKLQSGPVPDIGMLECSVNYPERHVELVSVVPEKKEGRWKPDLTATLKNGVLLYIEIQVTHAVHPEKALSLDNLMEIDLSKIDREMVYDAKDFTSYVITRAIRRWYQCSLYDGLKKVKEAQLELDLRASVLIASHATEENRRHNEQISKDREAKGLLFSQRTKAKEEFKASAIVREDLKDALIAIKQRKLVYRPEPAGGQDSIPIEGEWIFSVSRSTWQGFILSQCIQPMPINVVFTAAYLLPKLIA